jgi:hypothetical protein
MSDVSFTHANSSLDTPPLFPSDLLMVISREVVSLSLGIPTIFSRNSARPDHVLPASCSPPQLRLRLPVGSTLYSMAGGIVYPKEKDVDTEKNIQENDTVVTSREAGTGRVNAGGHRDQLDRQYGLLSICATALTIGESCLAFHIFVLPLIHHAYYRQCMGRPGRLHYRCRRQRRCPGHHI